MDEHRTDLFKLLLLSLLVTCVASVTGGCGPSPSPTALPEEGGQTMTLHPYVDRPQDKLHTTGTRDTEGHCRDMSRVSPTGNGTDGTHPFRGVPRVPPRHMRWDRLHIHTLLDN